MKDNLDFDASPLIYGDKTMEELRDALLKELAEVASGKLTRSEILGYYETAIARVGRYIRNAGSKQEQVETYYY